MLRRLYFVLFGLVALLATTGPLQATTPAPPGNTPQAAAGVWYEIFVRSWYDTNGDGIGDLNGVTAKLDYLKSLGVSGIWLMPINPSPSYHGYDVTDWWNQYRRGLDAVNPATYLVGEVTRDRASELAPWLKPLDAVFNFPLAKQLIAAAGSERNCGLGPTLDRIYAAYEATGGAAIKDAPFLSNHDQERVMSQLDDNAQHMRTAAAMLLTLPGEPYISPAS